MPDNEENFHGKVIIKMTTNNIYDSTHTQKTTIGYAAIGSQGTLKIVSILNFLQDAASEHASKMGVSGFDLAENNLSWVIYRYHINIFKHPAWQDGISIQTSRYPFKNIYEMRKFNIRDGAHEPLVEAVGAWVMVNRKNGRPLRLSRYMPPEMCRSKEKDTPPFSELQKPLSIDFELPFKVRMHDLDLNGHVNNAIYVEWAVETVPETIISNFQPAKIDVIFQKEALYGDTVISKTEIREKSLKISTYHSIIRKTDDIELARINVGWNPIEDNIYGR